MKKVKALVISNSKYRIVQHYRNGINIGDSLLFITKMAVQGHLLTDERYMCFINTLIDPTHPLFVGEESMPFDFATLEDSND